MNSIFAEPDAVPSILQETYPSLARRILFTYGGMMPDPDLIDKPGASAGSQRQMLGFLVAIAAAIYADPSLIGITVAVDRPDDAYDDWALRNSQPDLGKRMNEIKKKADDFYWQLIEIGTYGVIENTRLVVRKDQVKLPGRTRQVLAKTGIESMDVNDTLIFTSMRYPEIFPAWICLAQLAWAGPLDPPFPVVDHRVNSANSLYPILVFAHGLFQRCAESDDSRKVFYRLFPNPAVLRQLDATLTGKGYRYLDIRENEYSMDWVRYYGNKPEPLKGWWAERNHGGFSVTFDPTKRHPFVCGLRIPRFKELLAHFSGMDDALQAFIMRQTKKCDRCGYCTQTDKSGQRPRQLTKVTYQNQSYELCQLFPGFTYRWTTLDESLVQDVIRFLDFTDQLLRAADSSRDMNR